MTYKLKIYLENFGRTIKGQFEEDLKVKVLPLSSFLRKLKFLAIYPGTFCNSSTRAESGFLGCMFETKEVFFPGKMNPLSVLHSSLESIRSCFFTVSGWMGRTVAELYRGQ